MADLENHPPILSPNGVWHVHLCSCQVSGVFPVRYGELPQTEERRRGPPSGAPNLSVD